MNTEHPKVFISYAWSRQKTQDDVLELAQRLMQDGIEVVLDKWDFKEGHDKYVFMERCVNDSTIDRVLIVCDKAYQERANNRQGGVGDETVVISSEIYGNMQQEKFIPLIFESDEKGNPFLPAYIKSKKYINFSDENDYENSYEELLRNLYEMPVNKKPKLGQKPTWLNDEEVSSSELKLSLKILRRGAMEQRSRYHSIITKFVDDFVTTLNEFRFSEDKFNAEELVKKISSLKPIRDIYFDFLVTILGSQFFSTNFVVNFFERIHNEVGIVEKGSYNEATFEYYDFFRWESFIGTIAILLHHEKYEEVHSILNHTYFLSEYPLKNSRLIPCKFSKFRKPLRTLEFDYQKINQTRYLSYSAQLLTEREKMPILTKQLFAETDLLLYQLSTIFLSDESESISYFWKWFPSMYPYVKRKDLWVRLQSKSFCEKVLPLFGVKTINDLKLVISKATYDNSIRLNGAWDAALNILSYISVDKIAILK